MKFQLELFADNFNGTFDKIDLATIKKSSGPDDNFIVDKMQILQSILSKKFPPKRFNGILNLWLALRSIAKDDEIENALVSLGQKNKALRKICN